MYKKKVLLRKGGADPSIPLLVSSLKQQDGYKSVKMSQQSINQRCLFNQFYGKGETQAIKVVESSNQQTWRTEEKNHKKSSSAYIDGEVKGNQRIMASAAQINAKKNNQRLDQDHHTSIRGSINNSLLPEQFADTNDLNNSIPFRLNGPGLKNGINQQKVEQHNFDKAPSLTNTREVVPLNNSNNNQSKTQKFESGKQFGNSNSSINRSPDNDSDNEFDIQGNIGEEQSVAAQSIKIGEDSPAMLHQSEFSMRQSNQNYSKQNDAPLQLIGNARPSQAEGVQERKTLLFGIDLGNIQSHLNNAFGSIINQTPAQLKELSPMIDNSKSPHSVNSSKLMKQPVQDGQNDVSLRNIIMDIDLGTKPQKGSQSFRPSEVAVQQQNPFLSEKPNPWIKINQEIVKLIQFIKTSSQTKNKEQIEQLQAICSKIVQSDFNISNINPIQQYFVQLPQYFTADAQIIGKISVIQALLMNAAVTKPAVPHQIENKFKPNATNTSMSSNQPPKQRQTLVNHPNQQYRQGALNQNSKYGQDDEDDDVQDDVDESEIMKSPSIINIDAPKQVHHIKSSSTQVPHQAPIINIKKSESELRIEERLKKAQQEVEQEVQKRKRQLDKEQVVLFQDLCNEVKNDPAFAMFQPQLRMVQIPALYEKCKQQKIIKDQFKSFITAEYKKCIQHLGSKQRSVSPVDRDHRSSERSSNSKLKMIAQDMAVAPTVIIEHREINIFSGKKRNTRSSKSSVGAAAVGGKRASDFAIINEKEEDEDSKRGSIEQMKDNNQQVHPAAVDTSFTKPSNKQTNQRDSEKLIELMDQVPLPKKSNKSPLKFTSKPQSDNFEQKPKKITSLF